MNLATAQKYADQLCLWLEPYADLMMVAGSIRRQRPVCNDVDLVCIPQVTEERDMFEVVTSTTNHLHRFLRTYVASGRGTFQSGGETPGKAVILQLPKCQLDIWFATPETFATRLMCRTGSKEHNIWLASRAKRMGVKWNPYEGLISGGEWKQDGVGLNSGSVYCGGQVAAANSEEHLYAQLDLPYIEPENRELPWLVEKFGE